MALFYCYRKILIPKFTYARCETISEKALSVIGQTAFEQIILHTDVMLVAGMISSCVTMPVNHKGNEENYSGNTLVVAVALKEIKEIIYYGCHGIGTMYPLFRAGSRLYRNQMYIVKNKILTVAR
jgi:hypothetical protein